MDVSLVTGWDILRKLARSIGFPSASLSLITEDAKVVTLDSTLKDDLDPVDDNVILLTCVFGPARPVGAKAEMWNERPLHSKGQMLFQRQVQSLRGHKKDQICEA